MTDKPLDPYSAPSDWHRFLYKSVLLEWEVSLHQRKKFTRFNYRKALAGIQLVKVESLVGCDLDAHKRSQPHKPIEQLVFYSTGTALKDLFGLLRNCVAHGHYSCPRSGWIRFSHVFKGKMKLSGEVKFVSLKKIISTIVVDENLIKDPYKPPLKR